MLGRLRKLAIVVLGLMLSAATAGASAPITVVWSPPSGGSGRGVISLTINGSYVKSIRYGEFSDAASIAANFGGVLSLDPFSPVWAIGNIDGTVSMKSRHDAIASVTYCMQPDGASSCSSPPSWASLNPDPTGIAPVNPPSNAALYSYSITKADGTSGYAPNGNIVAYTDSVNGQWSATYDTLNRLVSARQTSQSTSIPAPWGAAMQQYLCWQYDNFGNRLQQVSSSQTMADPTTCAPQGSSLSSSYLMGNDSNNRVSSLPGAPSVTNDPAGNLTGDGMFTYKYDAAGRLCAVRKNVTGETTAYLYDASGNRVGKGTVNPQASDWCDFSSNGFTLTERSVLSQSGGTLTRFDNQGNSRSEVPIAGGVSATMTAASTGPVYTHYQFTDWLGTRRLQTDPNGNPEEKCSGGAFGDQLQCIGYGATDWHFTGKERDTESGLDHFQFRSYASTMGRWISPDPAGMQAVDIRYPQTLNRYAYVNNNPLAFTDPLGLDCAYLNDSGTDLEKGGLDQQSNAGECSKNGGYWVNGGLTDYHIDSNNGIVSLTGTDNGQQTSATYKDTFVNVGYYFNSAFNTAGHIALGLGGGTMYGLGPKSGLNFTLGGLASARIFERSVPGQIEKQVGGQLLQMVRVPVTGMQADVIRQRIQGDQTIPPDYAIYGARPSCDCATWAQQVLGDAGINTGPVEPRPASFINQLDLITPRVP